MGKRRREVSVDLPGFPGALRFKSTKKVRWVSGWVKQGDGPWQMMGYRVMTRWHRKQERWREKRGWTPSGSMGGWSAVGVGGRAASSNASPPSNGNAGRPSSPGALVVRELAGTRFPERTDG